MIGPKAKTSGNVEDRRTDSGPGQARLQQRLDSYFNSPTKPYDRNAAKRANEKLRRTTRSKAAEILYGAEADQ